MLSRKSISIITVILILIGGSLLVINSNRISNILTASSQNPTTVIFTDKGHTIQFQYPTGTTSTQISFSENFNIQSLDARYGDLNAPHAWYIMENGIGLFDSRIKSLNPHMTWNEYKNQQMRTTQDDRWNIYGNIHEINLGGQKALTFDKSTDSNSAPVNSITNKAWLPNSKVIQTIHNGKQYIIQFSSYNQAFDTDKSIASAYTTFISSFRFLK